MFYGPISEVERIIDKKIDMIKKKIILSFMVIIFIFSLQVSAAQTLEQRLNGLQKSISTKKGTKNKTLKELFDNEKKKEYTIRKENKYAQTISKISGKINSLEESITSLEENLKLLNQTLSELETDLSDLNEQLDFRQNVLGKRLRAIFKERKKYSALSRLIYLSQSANPTEFIKRIKMLNMLSNSDKKLIDSIVLQIEEIKLKKLKIKKLKKTKQNILINQKQNFQDLNKQKMKYHNLLNKTKLNKEHYKQVIKDLKRKMKVIDKAINRLVVQSKETSKQIKLNKMNFQKMKGKLNWPIDRTRYNKILVKYKNKDKNYFFDTISDGIEIKCKKNQKIKAAAGGVAILVSWLDGLGNTVIIAHGGNYFTLYSHLEKFNCSKDQKIYPLDIIGYAGNTGSLYGYSLYFQIRENKNTVDPLAWLKKD